MKENKIEFESIDVSENEEARNKMVEISNQLSVPVSEVNDNVIIGFDLKKFKEILGV